MVGPNGSGKSNVTDAVLFALGEQSPGLLRAGTMGDLIFSGSESLPAANVAEVTLVFDNEAGSISLPYREVSVSRRISRGGDAEYRVNGSRARLADVRAVAGEAGLGRHSILRQGAVDAIVAGGAAACRLAVEEAAGLGVYRRRRLSASRRLEKADTLLDKSRQLEAELTAQLQRIEREAVAAREYRELETRYRRLSLAHLYRVATRDLDRRREELRRCREQTAALSEREAALKNEEARIEPELRRLEGELHRREQWLEELEDFSERLRNEVMRSERALLRLEAERGRGGERARLVASLQTESGRVVRALERLRAESAEAEAGYEERRETLDRARRAVERARGRRNAADKDRARLAGHLEKLQARRDRSVVEGSVLGEGELENIAGVVREINRSPDAGQSDQTKNLKARIEEHRWRLQACEGGVRRRRGGLEAMIGRTQARARVLRIPENGEAAAPRLDEVIRARPGFEAAVEAAVGELGRAVLARDLSESMKLLANDERIALRLDAERVEETGEPPGRPLLECVQVVEDRYADAVGRLLGGIYVVETPVAGAPANGYVAVTRDGLRLTRTSVSLCRGEGRFVREARLRHELNRLDALENGFGGQLYDLEDAVSAARSRLRELGPGVESFVAALHRLERASGQLSRQARRRQSSAAAARQRRLEQERAAEELEGRISAAEAELEAAEAASEEARRELADATARAEREREPFEELSRRRERLRSAVADGERRRWELERRLKAVRDISETGTERAERVSARSVELVRALTAVLRERRSRLRSRRSALTDEHRRVAEQRAACSREAVELAGQIATARGAAVRVQEDLERAERSSAAAAEEVRDEWGATLEEARREAEGLPRDTDAERNRLARRLKRFGDVNLLAISQEQELRERHAFVAAQRADAEAAATELNRIIHEIDREIEARFTRTFGRVRRAFAEILPRMIRDSAGRLELTEEGIEVGLRLGRRGWKPLNVLSGGERALLALSFLFSIFLSRPEEPSSTFCMLDEAEAALDDVNLARFLAVVDSYRAGGQFILVTHQKRTMAAADVLYGVTQDASGATVVVSKRLSGE